MRKDPEEFVRDLENRIESIVVGIFVATMKVIGRYGWEFADRIFKLIAWIGVIAAVNAVRIKLGDNELSVSPTVAVPYNWTLLPIVITLSILWVIALFVSVIKGLIFFQDSVHEKLNAKPIHPIFRTVLAFIITMPMVYLGISVVLPYATFVFVILIDQAQKS